MTLLEFNTNTDSGNCIDDAWLKPMLGRCTQADIETLKLCLEELFTRRPLLQNTPPKQDKSRPLMLKSQAEIEEVWRNILWWRRWIEPDDTRAIKDSDKLGRLWVAWQKDWIRRELTAEQKRREWMRQTSIFNSWSHSQMGGRLFVMAVWQTGVTWVPPAEPLNTNPTVL